MHPWDNLEQNFLAYVGTVIEMAKTITNQAEYIEDAALADKIMNLGIGLESYAEMASHPIAEAMEAKISHDYKTFSPISCSWDLEVAPNSSVHLPPHLVENLPWKPGQKLIGRSNLDGVLEVRPAES